MNEMGNNMSKEQLFNDIMIRYPTLNVATIYTVLSVPADSYFNTSLFYGRLKGIEEDPPFERKNLIED